MKKYSALQKQVFELYRALLRAARTKDALLGQSPAAAESFSGQVRTQFRRDAESVTKRQFNRIEWMLRRGWRQIDLIGNVGTRSVGTLAANTAPPRPRD